MFLKREEHGAWSGQRAALPGSSGEQHRRGCEARVGAVAWPATPSSTASRDSGSWLPLKGKTEKQSSSYQVLDAQTLFWSGEPG